MSAVEELRGEIVAVGQEFVEIERDKESFIQQDVPPIQERIHLAAGMAAHLSGLIRGIMSDFNKAEAPAREFDERTATATQHLHETVGDSSILGALLSIVPQGGEAVDVRHNHKDSHGHPDISILLTYASKADAIAKGLGAMNGRISDNRAERIIMADLNIRRIERTVQGTIEKL